MTGSLGTLTGKCWMERGGWRWPVLMTCLAKVTGWIYSQTAPGKSFQTYFTKVRLLNKTIMSKGICTFERGIWRTSKLTAGVVVWSSMCVPVCFSHFPSAIHHYNWCHSALGIGKAYLEPLTCFSSNNGWPASYINHMTSFSWKLLAA